MLLGNSIPSLLLPFPQQQAVMLLQFSRLTLNTETLFHLNLSSSKTDLSGMGNAFKNTGDLLMSTSRRNQLWNHWNGILIGMLYAVA